MKVFTTVLTSVFIPGLVFAAPDISHVSGVVKHGSQITITGAGFGTKSNVAQTVPSAPLLWDITSQQFVGGVDKDAYAGLGDGSAVNTRDWQHVDGADATVRYSMNRQQRHPRLIAHYASSHPVSGYIKLDLGRPRR